MRKMNVLGVIPSRMSATRFPGKPLALIAGKPMIQRVYEQAKQASSLDDLVIATDSPEIVEEAKKFGAKTIMTSSQCQSGLERVIEVSSKVTGFTHFVNIQGDEPIIHPHSIDGVIELFSKNEDCSITTAATKLTEYQYFIEPSTVKVLLDHIGKAIYFSRSPIPYQTLQNFNGDTTLKHLGLYAYTLEALNTIKNMPRTYLEQTESLEQLRLLYHGLPIYVSLTEHDSIGVDLPRDVQRVEEILNHKV